MKTNNMKLIDKVKPEILDALKESRISYKASYSVMITDLGEVEHYRDLTIAQVSNLLTFLPKEFHPNGKTDFYWGDYLLQKQYQI